MNEISQYFGIWSFFGYFIMTASEPPKNKIQAGYQVFIGGPICWIIFIFLSVKYFKRIKKNE